MSSVHTDTVRTPDGRTLVFQTVGSGPPVILNNGLGGTFEAWRHLYTALADRYQVFSWYYRGLHGSSAPADRSRVHVDDHLADLLWLLDLWGVERAPFVGWSMGVQLNFELYRVAPERVVALAALNGLPGRLFEHVPAARLNRHLLPRLLGHASRHGHAVDKVVRRLTSWRGMVPAGKRIGFFGPDLDEELFASVIHDYGTLPFGLYAETLRQLGTHDAWAVLPTIQVPTTVIAGTRDPLTPARAAERMARQIPGAELIILPRASHFAAMEQPEAINRAVLGLLDRAGWA